MLLNFPNCQAMGMTTMTPTFGASTFNIIASIKNQIGVALWSGSTGIEVAGAGLSFATQAFTLISGVTKTLNFANQTNGSSLLLAGNGSGLPVFNANLLPIAFAGSPQLWISCGTTNLSLRITYFLNDAMGL